MIQTKVLLLSAVLVIASCTTIPEQPSSQPASDSTTASPEVTKEPIKQPHTHEEHPVDNPDHSDHPGHENDPKLEVKEPKHHDGDHTHDEKKDDGHDHKPHTEQPEVPKETPEDSPKPTPVEEVKEIDNETQEARFKRDLYQR